MKLKVLLVSDKKEDWDYFGRLLKSNFRKSELVGSGDIVTAEEQLKNNGPFALTIINTEIKSPTPLEIFEMVNENNEKRPVIFLGSQAMLQDRVPDTMYDTNEANGLLERPIDIPSFNEVIRTAFAWIESDQEERNTIEVDSKDKYVPMKIRNFYRFTKLPCDAFIELSENKFVRVVNANSEYDESLLQKLIKKGVKFLWLEKSEHVKYLIESIHLMLNYFKKRLSPLDIIKLQIKSVSLIHEHVRNIGVTDDVQELTKKVIRNGIQNIEEVNSYRELITIFPLKYKDAPERSILTFYTCLFLLHEIDWTSDLPKEKLGMASILHDCAITNDDMIFLKTLEAHALSNFEEEEIEEYKQHPIRAAEISRLYQGIGESGFLMAQHHELPNAKGFPQKLSSVHFSGLSALFILTTNFVTDIVTHGFNAEGLATAHAFSKEVFRDGIFKEPLKALTQILRKE